MKRFAQILEGKVHYVFESEVKPIVSKDIHIIEITNKKEVIEGWDYDIYKKVFSEPKIEVIEEVIDNTEKLIAQMRLEMINLLSELEVI